MNLVLTWASGEAFCRSEGFSVYLESLKVIRGADVVVFTHDMPDDIRQKLWKRRIEIIDVPLTEIHYLIRDRHLAYWRFLSSKLSQYKHCIVTDSKDVIFQIDPFPMLSTLPVSVVLVEEGMKHGDSGWNMIDQFEAQANVREFQVDLRPQPVINGGVFMGTTMGIKNLCFLIWSNSIRSMGRCTDQGVLNHLYHWLKYDSDYLVLGYKEGFCLTGEAVKTGLTAAEFRNGKFVSHSGSTFSIVHQWDRTEDKDGVLSHYLG
jgi:hypothetical protein